MSGARPLPRLLHRLLVYALPALLLATLYLLRCLHAGEASGRRIGFSFEDGTAGLVMRDVVAGFPADRAGIRNGDRLLEVEGHAIQRSIDYDRAALAFQRGVPVSFVVERGDRRLELELRPGIEPPRFDLAMDLIVASSYLALALLAISRSGQDVRLRLLYLYSLAIAAEIVLPFDPVTTTSLGLFAQLAFPLVTGLQMGTDLHMASLIPDRPAWLQRRPWVVPAYYVLGGGLALADALAVAVEASGGHLPWSSTRASFLQLDLGLPIWASAVVALLASRFFTHPQRAGRQQAGLVLLGILPWVAVVAFLGVRQLLGLVAVDVPQSVWNFVLLAYPVAMFIAILRYRLFDIELVIRKSLLYGALTSLLVLIFYAALGAGGALFARAMPGGTHSVWMVSAATLVLGLLFGPLRTHLQRWIDRRLFPESQTLRDRIESLAEELPARGKLPRMGEHLCLELCRLFGLRTAVLWVAAPPMGNLLALAAAGRASADAEQTALLSPEEPALRGLVRSGRPVPASLLLRGGGPLASRVREAEAEIAAPLLSHGRLVGLLLAGGKRSGERFVADELELLKLLADQAATVLENARLFESATFEGLTGLYRREAVQEILDREWNRAQRYDRPLSIALADLDRFKWVNDRCGHLVGDLVLQRVAAELKAQLRETDFIGRFGGEEFLIVLPETQLEGALHLAEKIRGQIAALTISLEDGSHLTVTISIGVASRAEVGGDGHIRSRGLVAAADAALYAAKRGGRDRVEAAAGEGLTRRGSDRPTPDPD